MKRTFVSAGWPYMYEIPGLHNCVPMLFADAVARYRRLRGDDVLLTSGADDHGSRVEFVAEGKGTTPRALVEGKLAATLPLLAAMDLSFDVFGRTSDPEHEAFVTRFVERLLERGAVERRTIPVPFCPGCDRHLPDRFTEGRCPRCGGSAFGNQCNDKRRCGAVLEPFELIDGRCAVCAGPFEARERAHLYLPLAPLRERLWAHITASHPVTTDVGVRALAALETTDGIVLTRDAAWGAPLPDAAELPGRTVYSWVDALLGKVSVTRGVAEAPWRHPGTDKLFFLGPDGIDFYAVLLPALLLASGDDWALDSFHIVTNDVLLYEGSVCSKSSRTGIHLPEALAVLPGDFWRFAVFVSEAQATGEGGAARGPKDADFRWDRFARDANRLLGALDRHVERLAGRGMPAAPTADGQMHRAREALDALRPAAAFASLLALIELPSAEAVASALDLVSCFLPATARRAQDLIAGRTQGRLLPELPLDGVALRRGYDSRVAARRDGADIAAELLDARADALCVCPARLAEE